MVSVVCRQSSAGRLQYFRVLPVNSKQIFVLFSTMKPETNSETNSCDLTTCDWVVSSASSSWKGLVSVVLNQKAMRIKDEVKVQVGNRTKVSLMWRSPCFLKLSWVGRWRRQSGETAFSGGCGAPWTLCTACTRSTRCPGYGYKPEDNKREKKNPHHNHWIKCSVQIFTNKKGIKSIMKLKNWTFSAGTF